jgi:hypothetical protein
MGTIYGEIQGGRRHAILVDDMDPAAILMQAEDGEDDEQITLTGIEGIPRSALKTLIRFLIPQTSKPAKRWRIAQLRLAILAQMTDVDDIGGQSFESLARELNCTRALLCHHSLRMVDSLGMDKAKLGKRRESRAVYSASATLAHKRRRERLSAAQAVWTAGTTPKPVSTP